MELKTKVSAEEGRQDLQIIRDFDIPVELLFKAYTEPEIVEQWMGTKVLKMENRQHGGYQFETTDPQGNKYRFHGAIHECILNERITRTFEFEKMPLGIQLEFLEFERLTDQTSRLKILSIFKSVAHRDKQLEMPFAQGLNMAHNRLEQIAKKK